MARQIYICTVTAPSEMANAVSKKKILNCFNNHFLGLTFKNKYLITESQNHRITESQNGRIWKGPLWVI